MRRLPLLPRDWAGASVSCRSPHPSWLPCRDRSPRPIRLACRVEALTRAGCLVVTKPVPRTIPFDGPEKYDGGPPQSPHSGPEKVVQGFQSIAGEWMGKTSSGSRRLLVAIVSGSWSSATMLGRLDRAGKLVDLWPHQFSSVPTRYCDDLINLSASQCRMTATPAPV
jgi:hypothetical protein